MIVRDDMNLDRLSGELGEFGSLRKSLSKIRKKIQKVSPIAKIKKTLKKKDPIRKLIRGRKKSGSAAPEPAEYEEVSEPESALPAYDPGYTELPGADYGAPPYYSPGGGYSDYGPGAPGSDMEVDPYADDGVEEEGDDMDEDEEGLPMAPTVPTVTPPPTIAPATTGTDYTWYYVGGAVLLAGVGVFFYLKKKGKI